MDRTNKTFDSVAMLSSYFEGDWDTNHIACSDSDVPSDQVFYKQNVKVNRRICVQGKKEYAGSGFELRFFDVERLRASIRHAVSDARQQGRSWASVGLYLYWVEGAERARLHPARYAKLSSHSWYASIWQGLHFAHSTRSRAAVIMRNLGLEGQRFLAAHWRRGDWFLGPHPRKLAQAELAEPSKFAEILRKHLVEQGLRKVFLMTQAAPGSEDMVALRSHLPGIDVVQAPILRGDRRALRQISIEMAIATVAEFFIAFGDGILQGGASMPSLLVLQMRTYTGCRPLDSNAFSFVTPQYQSALGV